MVVLEQFKDTPNVETPQHWLSWHADPSKRERVVSKTVNIIGADGNPYRKELWIKLSNLTNVSSGSNISIWENGDWSEVTFISYVN